MSDLHEPLLSSMSNIMFDFPFSTSHSPIKKKKIMLLSLIIILPTNFVKGYYH